MMIQRIVIPKPKRKGKKKIEYVGKLGREIRISPKTKVDINEPGLMMEFFTQTVEVLIGIGNDHHAHLVMDIDAWKALKSGEPLQIDTLKDYVIKYL